VRGKAASDAEVVYSTAGAGFADRVGGVAAAEHLGFAVRPSRRAVAPRRRAGRATTLVPDCDARAGRRRSTKRAEWDRRAYERDAIICEMTAFLFSIHPEFGGAVARGPALRTGQRLSARA